MIKIGIIGTENSHATFFAKYFNLPSPDSGKHRYDNIRVVGLMGQGDSANVLEDLAGAEFVTDRAEDFLGKVDAMMITSRKGSLHLQYALPFVKAGIPVFVDKPFTSSVEDAQALAAAIQASGAPVMGGSACKYADKVAELKQKVSELRAEGHLISAAMNFAVMLDSEYDGIYFYAPHLVEMGIEIFGSDIKSLRAERLKDSAVVTVKYADEIVSLHFTAFAAKSSCVLFGVTQNVYADIDINPVFMYEAERFANMVLSGKKTGADIADLVLPVKVIDAIEQSLAQNKEIVI